MYTMIRRLTSLLLAVCMLVAFLPADMFSASAADITYVYNFAEGLKTHHTNNSASFGSNPLSLTTDTTFDTLNTYSGSTAAWRFVRGRTNTGLIQHNGSAQEQYGVFLFSGSEGLNNYATFEINVPETGTYGISVTYYDYESARECAVYLSSASGNQPVLLDVSEQIVSINSGDMQYPTTGVLESKGAAYSVPLTAGNYYITFRPNTNQTANHNYFMLHNVKLTKNSDAAPAAAKKLAIYGNSGSILSAGATRQLRALQIPHSVASGYVHQPSVTWSSSNASVAGVNASTGLVTAGSTTGSAVIAATTSARREMVSVLVGNSKSQLYAINEDAQNYMRANESETVEIDNVFKNTYANSTSADQWCFAHSTITSPLRVAAYRSDVNSWYGAFVDIQDTQLAGRTVTFKINVESDGNYIPDIAYVNHTSSVTSNVYIYPTTYAAGSCPEEAYVAQTQAGSTNMAMEHAKGGVIALRKGEYYVTFKTTSTSGRYVFVNHIALLYQGAYSNANKASRIVIDNPTPKMTAGNDTYKLGVKALPSTADQTVTWGFAAGQNGYVSVNNGVLTASGTLKGSNVITATVDGREEVTSVSTGALLYTFNNVAKKYLAEQSLSSIAFDYFNDYSKVTVGDKWVFVGQDANTILPTVYQAHVDNNGNATYNERYGVFLDLGNGSDKWVRFKIRVDTSGWYTPEVLYRDNGPGNMRESEVYISPISQDPYTKHVMTLTPDANAPGAGTIKAKRSDEAMYLGAGEYYLTFKVGEYNGTLNANGEKTARYLYLYHLALVETDTEADPLTPKAVVITKPSEAMAPLAIGDTVQLTASVKPIWAVQDIVSWTSSNTDVATVDKNTGLVTAKGEGVALITATARDARSETVVIQVGSTAQVYAFNEVIKKYAESTGKLRVNIADDTTFTDAAYSWKNYHDFGQGWRLIEKYDSISTAYTGESAIEDGEGDKTDPNYKYGLFLLGNNNDSYAHFEIEITEDGYYTPEILQYLALNSSDTQGSRQVELYISPISCPTDDLMHEAYYVGTTELDGEADGDVIVTDLGLDSQRFDGIHLAKGKYNMVLKSAESIGRYIYLHAFVLHKTGPYVQPKPKDIRFINHVDEALYLSANASHTLIPMIHPLLAEQTVTWVSDNEAVATVSASGEITTKAVTEGTALITAISTADGTIVGKVRVIIGQKENSSYTFDFKAPVEKYRDFPTEFNDATAFNLFTTDFATSYTASTDGGSAPWMLLSTSASENYCNYTKSTSQGYGLFVMSSKTVGTYTQLKFKVDQDANYGTVLNISDWSKANDFDVYIAPINATDPTAERWKVGSHHITKRSNLAYGLELGERALYAGEYILTVKSTAVNYKGTSGGLISLHGLTLHRTGDAFYTLEGAQVRTKGDQGLRFISTIYKSEYNVDSSKVKEFGTVLLPKDFLLDGHDGSDLTLGYVGKNGAESAKVVAKNRYRDSLDSVTFTAVLINLEPRHYKRVFVARAYVIYVDENGVEQTVYGDTWTERSIFEVAENGLARNGENMSDDEKTALETIVKTAE